MLTTSIDPVALDALIDKLEERLVERLTDRLTTAASSPWLTVQEAADHVRTSPGAIYKRIKRGQLPGHRPYGSKILIHRDDLDRAGPRGPEVL
jgi:excisionase family DNA binding protein